MSTFNLLLSVSSVLAAFIIARSPVYFRKKGFGKEKVGSMVITFGIAGTFLGVFLGLLKFDPNSITESVPLLLGGLKTAFITSIAGLFANIALRIWPQWYGYEKEDQVTKTDNVGEMLVKSMDKLTVAIAGDGEMSMNTHLQKIRIVNQDGFNELTNSFNEFAEKMVADNTQSLIDALTDVMQDFNTKINEQFGDNFRQLNEGVGAMLEWQKEYKSHVETLTSKIKSIATNLDGIDQSLARTSQSHQNIYDKNELLNELLKDFSGQVQSFADLGEKAKHSFPIIEQNMNNLTRSASEFMRESVAELDTNYKTYAQTQHQVMESYKSSLEKMINDNAERVKKLDEELGKELNKSLQSLGSQLTSLSNHFVSDYKPLTDKLKSVLEMSNGLN